MRLGLAMHNALKRSPIAHAPVNLSTASLIATCAGREALAFKASCALADTKFVQELALADGAKNGGSGLSRGSIQRGEIHMSGEIG